MLNNNLFTKTDRFEAQQFTGTVENTAEILRWLAERKYDAQVEVHKTTRVHLGKIVVNDEKVIRVEDEKGMVGFTLYAGGWLIAEQTVFGRYLISFDTAEDFEKNFQVVK